MVLLVMFGVVGHCGFDWFVGFYVIVGYVGDCSGLVMVLVMVPVMIMVLRMRIYSVLVMVMMLSRHVVMRLQLELVFIWRFIGVLFCGW